LIFHANVYQHNILASSVPGLSRLKMSYKKKDLWTLLRTQHEFSAVMHQASNIISDLVCQGDRNVYEADTDPAKGTLTAMFTFSASGLMCLPTVIY
jgi:hypothetical protein